MEENRRAYKKRRSEQKELRNVFKARLSAKFQIPKLYVEKRTVNKPLPGNNKQSKKTKKLKKFK